MLEPSRNRSRLGAYRLLAPIGKGGMAEVFVARRIGAVGFEKTVVVKRIRPGFADEPGFVKMFIEEAKLSAELHHPNIVQIHDLGQVDGQLFIRHGVRCREENRPGHESGGSR